MKDINKMSVADVVASAAFKTNLQKVIDAVCESRLKLANAARQRDRQLKRHPIDRFIDADELTVENLTVEYLKILEKQSTRPAIERANIMMLCFESYQTTIKEMAKGNPEAEKRLKK